MDQNNTPTSKPESSVESGSSMDKTSQPTANRSTTGQMTAAHTVEPEKSSGKLKKLSPLMIGLVVGFLLIAGSAAAYLGFVIPNKPENIWKSALTNTAKGSERLISYAEHQEEIKGLKLNGNFSLSSPQASGDANIDMAFYEKSGQGTLDVGFAGSRYTAEIRAIEAENAEYPDVYVKLGGLDGLAPLLSGLGDAANYGPLVDSINDQWIFVDHTLLNQAAAGLTQQTSEATTPSLSKPDVTEIAKKIAEVNKQYLFSADSEDAVFTVAEEVGKEEFEGRESFKFKVGADQDNLKEYIEALKTELKSTKLPEVIDEDYDKSFDEVIDGIDKDFDGNETVDVWVDMQTKLIRNIRFYDEENQNDYFDLSLLYEGGDSYPLRFKFQDSDEKINGTILMTLNTDQDSFEVAIDGESEQENLTLSGVITVSPQKDVVTVEKPADAKSVNEVLALLLGASVEAQDDGSPALNSPSDFSELNNSFLNGFEL